MATHCAGPSPTDERDRRVCRILNTMTDGADKPGRPSDPETENGTDAKDVVLLGPPTDDGHGVHVLRARDQRLEAGELRNLEEGQPITGEVVSLAPRKNNPRICDVRESYRPPSLTTSP